MADKKISALDAATTPLAGTEVLPIVQSSTTKKVSVSDLTAGRAVTAGSMSIGGAVNAGWGSTTRVVQTALSGALSGSTASFRAVVSNNVYYDNTNWRHMYGIGASFYEQNAGSHYWFTAPTGTADAVANLTQVMSIVQSNNNVKVDVGNLVIGTSGKGIDFSAAGNAAGMTSELLNDYEEGTWTPVVAGDTTPGTYELIASSTGRYVKIGSVVYWWVDLRLSSVVTGGGSGFFTITGLPFTASNTINFGPAMVYHFGITTTDAYVGLSPYSGTKLLLASYSAAGGQNIVDISAAVPTGYIRSYGQYFV